MSGECSIHGSDAKCLQNFGWKSKREGTTWETYADRRIIQVLRWIFGKHGVSIVMNLPVP
jgi:hypothetical protein